MSLPDRLFNFSVDERLFRDLLQSFQDHLRVHDDQIEKLFAAQRDGAIVRLLGEKADKTDLEMRCGDLRTDLMAVLNSLRRDIDARVSSLELDASSTNGRLDHAETQLQTLQDLPRGPSAADFDRALSRLKEVESQSAAIATKLQSTRDAVQHVASAFGSIHQSRISIESGLQRGLRSTAEHIRNNFSLLFDGVSRLSSDVSRLTDGPAGQRYDTDFSTIDLRPAAPANFADPPKLPRLAKFRDVGDIVSYIYDTVPRLQGFLDAMHGKIAEVADIVPDLAVRAGVELTLAQLGSNVAELQRSVADVRVHVGRAATKGEVTAIARRLQGIQDGDAATSTSIGIVKCIACGREMQQVAGAMTEDEADRLLGAPPNCVAAAPQSDAPFVPIYAASGSEAFDTAGMIESPRAVRPFRATVAVRRKLQIPAAPK
jgi:hypothetical protein